MMIALLHHPLCQALAELWECYPSMRFGQLIAFATSLTGDGTPGVVESAENAAVLEAVKGSVAHRRGQVQAPSTEATGLREDLPQVFEALALRYPKLRFGQLAARVAESAYTNLYDIEDVTFLAAARNLLKSRDSLAPISYVVTFPHVIHTRLKYVDKMDPSDYGRVTVLDGREMIRWYFGPTQGRRYEEGVNSDWNRASPDTLTEQNLQNAKNANSMGWSYERLRPLLGQRFPELERIPSEADLFATNQYDTDAIQLLEGLLAANWRGLKVANLGKLFYQKRPRLIPILDEFVRRMMNIPYLRDEDASYQCSLKRLEEMAIAYGDGCPALQVLASTLSLNRGLSAFGLGFHQFRYHAGVSNNAQALHNLSKWIEEEGANAYRIPPVSRLRILDIVAWGAFWDLRNDRGETKRILISEN